MMHSKTDLSKALYYCRPSGVLDPQLNEQTLLFLFQPPQRTDLTAVHGTMHVKLHCMHSERQMYSVGDWECTHFECADLVQTVHSRL